MTGLAVLVIISSCSRQEPRILSEGSARSTGYVLGPAEGETVLAQSPRGTVTIKVSPRTGSAKAAMGTQMLAPKSQVRVHVHHKADEILFVHRGEGMAVVGESRREVKTGSTIFVPAGVWHGVENSDQQMELLWYASPPGLDAFFRDFDKATVGGTKQLMFDQFQEIAKKHGDMYKTP
jgi:quercetin dioxygenase-like cupin family protein